jgi:hypothetical protein
MLKFSGFHFTKPALYSIAILGLALITVDASAQSENEKVEDHYLKINDRVLLEENSSLQDNQSSPIHTVKPSNTVKTPQTAVVRREALPVVGATEKDIRKNESPSTLSFNIFLYIVDKFKAD